MQNGFYHANHKLNGWRVVEVVPRLNGHVLDRGFRVAMSEYVEFQGPLRPQIGEPATTEDDFGRAVAAAAQAQTWTVRP